jgi:GalNAc-alpha-(1->4)-GalNAc-alpha-(1->3)-diNAcBac-PP-undecaprenol alpha-1,4-N-acetyl-D-galactosaminyltransferase
MKKIIFITNNLSAGGAEKQIWHLSKYLNKNNKITVITLTDLKHKDFYKLDKNIERIRLQNNIGKNNIFYNLIKLFLLIIELRNILKLNKPDTIISFLTFANLTTILASFNLGIKKIISERTDLNYFKIPLKYKILSFLIYRFADLLVVQSKNIKNYFINYNVNIKVIYNIISNNRNLLKKTILIF